jgi:hypothetical protein
MTDWASSGGVKIERAKEHVGNLAAAISEFHQTEPYVPFREDDPNTGALNIRVRIRESPPLRLGAIAGDVIHNLRAALDILWHTAMPPRPGRVSSGFPFYNGSQEFENACRGAVKGRFKKAMDILKPIKPYKTGNNLLWGLHVADIRDKHHGLIPAYASSNPLLFLDVMKFAREMPRPPEWGEVPPDLSHFLSVKGTTVCPVQDGAVIGRFDREHRPKVDMKVEIPIYVAFGEPEVLKGEPLVDTLTQMAGVVDGIAESFCIAGLVK